MATTKKTKKKRSVLAHPNRRAKTRSCAPTPTVVTGVAIIGMTFAISQDVCVCISFVPVISVQFGVLRFGLFQYGYVGIGILPNREKVLVRGLRLICLPCHGVSAPKTQKRECADDIDTYRPFVVDDLLKLGDCLRSLTRCQVCLSPEIRDRHISQVIGQSGTQDFNRLRRVLLLKRNRCPNLRARNKPKDSTFGFLIRQLGYNLIGLLRIARKRNSKRRQCSICFRGRSERLLRLLSRHVYVSHERFVSGTQCHEVRVFESSAFHGGHSQW